MSVSSLAEPESPASIESVTEDKEQDAGNGLTLEGPPFGLEKIYDYEPGGHHSVHLNDRLGKEYRYKVIHKLGNGGFANVWLCRDLKGGSMKYVAVKILMAESSTNDCGELLVNKFKEKGLDREIGEKYICLPLDQFQIDGHNGLHLCFVYPVLGPRVSYINSQSENPDRDCERLLARLSKACLAFTATEFVMEVDFTLRNVLLRISSLDGLTEDQVLKAFGHPIQVKFVTMTGETPCDQTVPKYLVKPIDFYSVDSQFMTNEACIIDFGESFEVSSPPEDLGIPQSYCSPELVFDKIAGVGSDLWALGCTLFEIRTGRKLFDTFDGDVDDHIYMMVLILGKLPEPWWSALEAHKDSFEEEADSEGRAKKMNELMEETLSPTDQAAYSDIPDPRSIRDALAGGLVGTDYGSGRIRQHHRDILKNEIEIFADLLGKILKYDPRERLSAAEVLDHEWFKM